MKIIRYGGWIFLSNEIHNLDNNKCGKWMYFFDNKKFIAQMCKKAIEHNAITECKFSDKDEGVACFYLNYDDIDAHKRILNFMIENNLIKKTKAGKYYNMSFKLNSQTRNMEYGSNYSSDIKLSNFIDLESGKWII